MKNTIIYFLTICFLFIGKESTAQCSCQVNLEKITPCCAKLQVILTGMCPNISSIDVISNDPRFPGNITSVLGLGGSIGTVNGNTNASFTPPSSLNNPNTVGQVIDIGEICYAGVNFNVLSKIELKDANNNLVCQSFAEFLTDCPVPTDWKKIYGSVEEEKPRLVKAFGDGVYVIKSKHLPGGPYASFAKYDITSGALLWDRHLNTPSEFWDFDYYPVTGEFFIVGNTLPFTTSGVTFNNHSIIVKYDVNGVLKGQATYAQTGRETFEEVVVHKNPRDPSFPIYILGRKNPIGQAPSGTDLTVLFNVNKNCDVNWIREYPQISNNAGEIEATKGMTQLRNGGLVFLGNGFMNHGLLMHIDGKDGDFLKGVYYPGVIDLYSAIETPSGELIIAGTDWGNHQAVIMVTDNAPNFNVVSGLKYQDADTFREIWTDQYNNVYAVDNLKAAAPNNYSTVHSLSYDPTTRTLTQNYRKYLEDNETDFSDPHIFVSAAHDRIFYVDARKDHPNGFGDFDLMVGSFDLQMTCMCSNDYLPQGQAYTINNINFTCRDLNLMEPPKLAKFGTTEFEDACSNFCGGPPPTCDFTFNVNCFDVTLNGIANGTGPFTYNWDIDCDNSVDITGQNPTWTFPSVPASSTHCIELTIIDAAGVACTIQKQVLVEDVTPPQLNCPTDITLNTDLGKCYATYQFPVTTDNCDPNPSSACSITGVTIGDQTTTQFNKGVSNVICKAQDASSNISTCNFNITVVDNEPPVIITCPSDITRTVPGCEGGLKVNFPIPTFDDNCTMITITGTHQPEEYFSCGQTRVTYTATDMAGNMTSCSFIINVICECAEVVEKKIKCDANDENAQIFLIKLKSLAGLPNPSQSCAASVITNQSGVVLSNITTTWVGLDVIITGTATFSGCPFPNSLNLIANMTCSCPQAPQLACDIPVSIATQCCKTVSIDDANVCRTGPTVSIPLVGCNNLCDVQQVKWYVVDAPCPPTSWGTPFQVTQGCLPLLIDPQYHNGDICIYAEVITGGGDGPCRGSIITDPATITLCVPVGCSISSSQSYCYTGTPITPSLLTVSPAPANPNCPYTFQWFDANGAIAGATGTTYQPPALSLPSGSQDCNKSFTYTVKITSECGTQSCSVSIQLDNDDAPVGDLIMDPLEPLPFCPGEDATMRYTPACAGTPERWSWNISNDGSTFTPITTAGDRNPLYNTNRLYQDTWYRIEKQNGTCAIDEIDFYIPVNSPIQVTSFQALHAPVCAATSVKMIVDFTPVLTNPCDYTINWYRNGQVIHTSTAQSGPVAWSWVPPSPPAGIAGNYYVIISNNCCNQKIKSQVVQVDPPCEVFALGPCFRCKEEVVTLTGVVVNPITGANCSYQWYDENGAIPGATGMTLQVQPSQKGPFKFEVTCLINGATCVKSDVFNLKQCGDNSQLITAVIEVEQLDAKIYPNPTTARVNIQLEIPAEANIQVQVMDMSGRLLKEKIFEEGTTRTTIDFMGNVDGIYIVSIIKDGIPVWMEKVIKM